MDITSVAFLVFTLVVLVLYYLIPQRAQNLLLLVASYLFLASWNVQFALVFFVLTLINYSAAIYVAREDVKSKIALYLGISINILALVYFKYANFFIPSAITWLNKLGIKPSSTDIHVLLPIGLSFFVVQVISYLLDVSKGITSRATNIIDFAVYMAYFPRVVSGPIERWRSFLPELQNRRKIDKKQMGESFILIVQGLVRKVILADLLFLITPYNVFSDPRKFSSLELVLWLLAYSFAIYNDFAGYTSIARGISGFIGISLVENFRTPYLSRNFTEFWQRWHISLSTWLREYIFMPLTRFFRRRRSTLNDFLSIVLPPLVTMFISALWHNASWNMLVWGGLYGIYLVVERLITLRNPPKTANSPWNWKQFPAMLLVFGLVALAWVPFHANISATLAYWAGLFSPARWLSTLANLSAVRHNILNRYGFDVIILVGISMLLDVSQERFGELAILKAPVPVRAFLLNLAILGLIIATMAMSVPPPFIYQGF
jgi:alginate O-acetyltransferase complex protein AlgI